MIPEVFSNHKVTSYSVVPVLTQAATFSETPAENIKIAINMRDVTYHTRIFYSGKNVTFIREIRSHVSIKCSKVTQTRIPRSWHILVVSSLVYNMVS